jgi:hypothetical protein
MSPPDADSLDSDEEEAEEEGNRHTKLIANRTVNTSFSHKMRSEASSSDTKDLPTQWSCASSLLLDCSLSVQRTVS